MAKNRYIGEYPVIGITHLSWAIYNTAHHGNFQFTQMSKGFFHLSNRLL